MNAAAAALPLAPTAGSGAAGVRDLWCERCRAVRECVKMSASACAVARTRRTSAITCKGVVRKGG
eukprot:scaffold30240_cov67-Isochrysis_galbana.AAC.1